MKIPIVKINTTPEQQKLIDLALGYDPVRENPILKAWVDEPLRDVKDLDEATEAELAVIEFNKSEEMRKKMRDSIFNPDEQTKEAMELDSEYSTLEFK